MQYNNRAILGMIASAINPLNTDVRKHIYFRQDLAEFEVTPDSNVAEGIVYAGDAFVQAQYRVNVAPGCKENDIHIGDRVRVWLEIIKEE